MNNDNYVPKIGEKVKLINSGKNLTREMIVIIEQNPIVEVTSYKNDNGQGSIEFENSGLWYWNYRDGHWESIGKLKKSNKSYNKALIKLLKEIT